MRNRLPLTVDGGLWDAMAEDCGIAFADSYLSGASHVGKRLTPHTVSAYLAIKRKPQAMAVLRSKGLVLIEPLPFGHPGRPDSFRMAAE